MPDDVVDVKMGLSVDAVMELLLPSPVSGDDRIVVPV